MALPDRPLIIDEVQRGGDPLVLTIKAAVDADSSRGQFLLAGSTRFLAEPRLSESLAGRARFVDLWPLSQGEIDETVRGDRLIDALFEAPANLADGVTVLVSRAEVMTRITRGGFPEAVLSGSDRTRRAFFADYVRTVSQRDITELSRLGERVDFDRVLRLVAARTANELNATSLANDAGLGSETMRRYLPLLEAAHTVDDGDLRHLAWLRDRLGERFSVGVRLHLGDRPRPWGDRLVSLPTSALWDDAW